MHRYSVPSNPRTAGQLASRQLLTWLNHAWLQGQQPVRLAFQRYDTVKKAGARQLFIGANARALHGQANVNRLILSPSSNGGATTGSYTLTAQSNGFRINYTWPAATTLLTPSFSQYAILRQQDPHGTWTTWSRQSGSAYPTPSTSPTGLGHGITYVVILYYAWVDSRNRNQFGPSIAHTVTTL